MPAECALCLTDPADLSGLPLRDHVFADNSWRVVVNASALRGWLLVATRRHVATLAELSADEEASMGKVLALGSRVLTDVVGCVKTYAMLFTEGTSHVHFSLVPRMADIPDSLKGANVSGYNKLGPPLDEAQRDALAGELAEGFARRS